MGFEVLEFGAVYSVKLACVQSQWDRKKNFKKQELRTFDIFPVIMKIQLGSENSFHSRGKTLDPRYIGRAVVYAASQPDYVDVNEIKIRTIRVNQLIKMCLKKLTQSIIYKENRHYSSDSLAKIS